MEPYDALPEPDPYSASRDAFERLISTLADGPAADLSHDELEAQLEELGRELLRHLMQNHLDQRARKEEDTMRADRGQPLVLGPEGQPRTWREMGHRRLLTCVFGPVRVTRIAHRGRGVANVHPADEKLSLPAGRHSRGLARLAVLEAVRGSFDQAAAAIERRCGKVLGKRRLKELVVASAVDIAAYYTAKIPTPCTREMPLVIEIDGKGVVMRPEALREATRRAAAKSAAAGRRGRLAPGEKPNRKRMATVACVFDVVPAPRRPHDIVHPPGGRSETRPPRQGPKAERKWCTASVMHSPELVVADAFDQAEARDPRHLRDWLVLVDGARHQLDLIQAEADRRGIHLNILLDFVHVAEYTWTDAHAFHPVGSREAETWAADKLTAILAGHADRAATEMTAQAAAEQLPATRCDAVTTCARYLTGHLDQLHYDTALTAGWPIATGAVEGACRHLIADRLDITGARWGLDGAEAVLQLRALITNGDFEDYWRYHAVREHQRLYPSPDPQNYGLTA
ncbi:ISKra4 family transposase [Streptomyces aquilus]|uniref:ISKra4 family transposase n=1 Tax=Streptomyces aquilus TaxID=2548456 RepID=A0A3Q9BV45_9ACTN|nr:ISKra4 family transposase [Streptomyces aquilus]AZP14776.1 ISKra4 family transposase [Streptomyces aquilus]AZP22928.1 ISKra4 family transposase [Streptomyces aquilus]